MLRTLRRFYAAFSSLALAAVFVSPVQALDAESECAKLGRPNIDCACVATRIDAFNALSPSAEGKAVIDQGYLHALGEENNFLEVLSASMNDPMAALAIFTAYDPMGGRPENITTYEEGCVIPGAPKPTVTAPESFPAMDQYMANCNKSTGKPRYCACDAGRKSQHLDQREFEAYFRSFTDYSDDNARSHDELAAMRGKAMGMSGDAYQALESSARATLAKFEESDGNYCAALLWAD